MESVIQIGMVAIAVGITALYSIVAIRHCVLAMRWLPRHERWSRKQEGCCLDCGYNLKGNTSGICPECGKEIPCANPKDTVPIVPSLIEKQPRWVFLTVITIMTLTVILQLILWWI